MDIRQQITDLKNILNEHNINYYVHDNPTISDLEYDNLISKLIKLENDNPSSDTSILPKLNKPPWPNPSSLKICEAKGFAAVAIEGIQHWNTMLPPK